MGRKKRKNVAEWKRSKEKRMSRQGDSVVNLPVCKSLYIKTLGISRDRVQNVCKKFFETRNAPLESRGGDQKGELYLGRKKSVKKFIESVPVLESHYCRGKNIYRQYVSSDLSIKKLWDYY
ncbi:hypothetical protein J6590_031261 [Homalodisca vitripennis]|nr:hypothetical protein J6590_031261 [Homalodisca vitripennis]